MKQTIDCKCGIYDTEYTLTVTGDKMTVKAPYIKWVNNNGSLAFRRVVVRDEDKADVQAFFDEDVLVLPANNNAENLGLVDVLDGNRYPDVHVITED